MVMMMDKSCERPSCHAAVLKSQVRNKLAPWKTRPPSGHAAVRARQTRHTKEVPAVKMVVHWALGRKTRSAFFTPPVLAGACFTRPLRIKKKIT